MKLKSYCRGSSVSVAINSLWSTSIFFLVIKWSAYYPVMSRRLRWNNGNTAGFAWKSAENGAPKMTSMNIRMDLYIENLPDDSRPRVMRLDDLNGWMTSPDSRFEITWRTKSTHKEDTLTYLANFSKRRYKIIVGILLFLSLLGDLPTFV